MILHEPHVDEYFLPLSIVLSMNLVVLFTNHLLFYYSSPKTSEDPHELIMKLQQYLLDELENSKDNPGRTLRGVKYDNDLYVSMKAFWDQFTGEITHETACKSCKSTIESQEPIDYLLLKFPPGDDDKQYDDDCTVESLIKYHLQEQCIEDYQCSCCKEGTSGTRKSDITKFSSSCAFYFVEEEEEESGEVDSSSGEESSSPAVVHPRPLPHHRNPKVLTSTDSSGSSSYSSDSSSLGSSSDS